LIKKKFRILIYIFEQMSNDLDGLREKIRE